MLAGVGWRCGSGCRSTRFDRLGWGGSRIRPCGACLEFHRNRRSVRTASSEQVRRPIDEAGVAQWRHYEPWLAPLKAALGADLVRDVD